MNDRNLKEALRLKRLNSYGILDTPPEPQFDDIAALASELCGAPIAAVAFADRYRHWSKARVGLPWTEIAWDHALCSAAIDGEIDPLICEDLAADPRFRDHFYVRGRPFLRFYGGVLLRAPDGTPVGTLCVMDFKTRPGGLTAAQISGLQALARHTMALLWLRMALGQ